MATTPLADITDVMSLMDRSLTSGETTKANGVLVKASALFRRRARQKFTPGVSTARIRVHGGIAFLRERPVESVESVILDGGTTPSWTRVGQWLSIDTAESFVTVSYHHGGDVPDDVRLCIADIARQVILIPAEAQAAITQQTSGPFSRSYASWALGGQTRLSPDDAALADSYRRRPWRPPVVQVP